MKEVQCLFLLPVVTAAVFFDLKQDRIPNWLIVCGLSVGWSIQIMESQILGIFLFLWGVGVPLILGSFLYYFRMMGAGDIKLLSVAGGFMGPEKVFVCILASLFTGGLLALILILRRRNLRERMDYFGHYVTEWIHTGKWRPYLTGKDKSGKMHFALAVLAAILLYAGGVY